MAQPLSADSRATTRTHRRALARRLPDGLIVLKAAAPARRNGDVDYRFRQDSNFLYLTGVLEPGYALVLDPRRGEETLFVPKLTQAHAVWLGHLPDLAEAREAFGIRDVAYLDELPKALQARSRGYKVVYADARSRGAMRRAGPRPRLDSAALHDALEELRIVKDEGEIALLEKASSATARGHLAAMRAARAGAWEYQIQAVMEQEFRLAGCPETGYDSIVAAGRNGSILHYHHNHDRLRAGDLLLIDAAAEHQGYTADVTRAFPVSGRFSSRQRDVYEAVLRAQEGCLDFARAGVTSMDVQHRSEEILADGLKGLGLLKGSVAEIVDTQAVRVFYPHGIGHTLGLDVHDVQGGRRRLLPRRKSGRLRFRARLEPGFVMTIEPGLYFMPVLLDDPEVRRKHRGRIDFDRAQGFLGVGGVRIEDDVVIRKGAPPRNLTRVPKAVAEVEAACARS
jgi:Xaa-Pro aminopeptidase